MRPTRTFLALFALVWCVLVAALTGCGRGDLELPDYSDALTDTADESGDGALDSGGDAPTDSPTDVDTGPPTVVSVSVDPATVTLPIGGTRAFTARALLSDGTTTDVTKTAAWSSDLGTSVVVEATGLATAKAAGVARVRATITGVFGEAIVTVPAATVTDVKVDPGTAETTLGGTVSFSATATLSDGTVTDVTASATWASDAPAIATVSGGIATGVAAGTTTIRATLSGKTGTASLNVTTKTLGSIEVAPFAPTLGIGVSLPLVATAIYTDGTKADVTTSATWSSSAATVTVVASGAAAGQAKGVTAGTAVVTASFGGKTGSTTVTVTAATLTALVVSPSAATLAVGGTAKLVATATYSDGSTSDLTASAVWTSSDGSIAAVASGVVTGVANGSATITASFGGKSGTAAITVSPAKLLSITITPADPSLPLGATLTLKATGLYEGGSSRDITADVAWSTDDTTFATVSNATGTAGRVTPIAAGKTTVRAKLDGVEGSTSLTVTAKAVTSIAVSSLSLVRSTKAFATATATYSDGTTLDVTTGCTWSTASAAIATVSNGTGSQGLVTGVAVGTTTLTCAFGGATGSGTLTITAPAVDTISISPVAPTCHIGETLRFTATAISSAGTSTNVTNLATWTTSPSGLLTAATGGGPGGGGPGAYRCTAKGTATVSATRAGITGSTPVTITDAVVVGVQVDPVTLSLPIGGTQAYVATAVYSDGTTVNVTNLATWSSSAPAVAGITTGGGGGPGGGGPRGQATALTAGSTTIKATYSGFTGTATLTVTSAVLTSITVSPATNAVPVGVRFTYSATAVYSDGTTKDVTTAASWTSSATAVAQVSDAGPTRGQATALKAGTATITAAFGGLTGKATLTVTTATLAKVEVTPATSTLSVGSTVVLKAYGVYSDGSKFEVTTLAAWSSADTTVVTVVTGSSTAGQATALKTGTVTVTATYSGLGGTATLTGI